MPEVIADTSPVQYLYQTNLLDLLPTLYGQVTLPQQKPRYLELRDEQQTLSMPLATGHGKFEIHARLSSEMSYLTLLTLGLARYEAEDYDSAIARFIGALAQTSVPEQLVNPVDIYFYRGTAYLNKDDLNRAIADFKKALELTKDSQRRQDTEKQLQELGVK